MPLVCSSPVSSNVTKTLICIDDISVFDLRGRMYSPYLPDQLEFDGVASLLSGMEKLFDSFAFPQRTFSPRSFKPEGSVAGANQKTEVRRYMDESVFAEKTGEKATFIIQVQFRQNATWQGTIQWVDQKITRKFRSTLELIKLMNDTVSEDEDKQEEPLAKW